MSIFVDFPVIFPVVGVTHLFTAGFFFPVILRKYIKPTRNATRYNNRNVLLHLSFTLKIAIFSEAYI